MIETESVKMPGYEHAIRNINAKWYRMSKIGSFETFVSVNSKSISI